MSKEDDRLNSSETQIYFKEWCRREGIQRFLFDLDDTLCPTRAVFKSVMSQAFDFLATNTSIITREKWQEDIETINNRLFEKMGVNSNRWNFVVDELSEKYLLDNLLSIKVKRIFQLIYSTPLSMTDGADEGLQFIKKSGIPIGIVTHAGKDWTMKKYDWLNLERFIIRDDIFIVDENGHKTSDSWLQAILYFGLNSGQCAVVGDSPRSDINPAMQAGVKHCFLVEDPNQWSVHNQPVHESVKKINSLKQIIDMI